MLSPELITNSGPAPDAHSLQPYSASTLFSKPRPDFIRLIRSPSPSPASSSRSSSPLTPTRSWPEASHLPDHQLTITLIAATDLVFKSDAQRLGAKPYGVIQFDQTESVTLEASSSTSLGAPKLNRRTTGFMKPPTNAMIARCPSASSLSCGPQICLTENCRASEADRPIWNHHAVFDVFRSKGSVFVSIYDRRSNEPGFLGGAIIELDYESQLFSGHPTVILQDDQLDLWDSIGQNLAGKISLKIELVQIVRSDRPRPRIGADHFEVVKLIGEGSYGQVFRVRKKDTKRVYAMKVLSKSKILKDHSKQTLRHVLTERKILIMTSSSSFLVGLKFSFQSEDSLHLVMDLKAGGELMSYMQKYGGRFPEDWARFYTAEILSGLKYLHSLNIVYRDLKPENCLLDSMGHVSLCDFGLSKMGMTADSVTKTFCGTTEYIAPEVLLETGYTRSVDFWSLGILIFEMSVGWTPFFSEDRAARYSLILECDISTKFPKRGLGEASRDLISRLLEKDMVKRLGANGGAEEIEKHLFFDSIDWLALVGRRLTPPFKPKVESDAELCQSDRVAAHDLKWAGMGGAVSHSRRSSVEGTRRPPAPRLSVDKGDEFRDFTFFRDGSTESQPPPQEYFGSGQRLSEHQYLAGA